MTNLYRCDTFISSELVQLKLNITRFYEVKYALGFGGGLYSHRRKNKEPTLIEVGVLGI